jgi:hypothetical protein
MTKKKKVDLELEESLEDLLELQQTPPGIPWVYCEDVLQDIMFSFTDIYLEKDAILSAGEHIIRFLDVFMTPVQLKDYNRDYRPFIIERIMKLAELEKSIMSKPNSSESEALQDEIRFTTAFWEVVIMVIHLYKNYRVIPKDEFDHALQNPRLHLLYGDAPTRNQLIAICYNLIIRVRLWTLDHLQTKNEGRYNISTFWELSPEETE